MDDCPHGNPNCYSMFGRCGDCRADYGDEDDGCDEHGADHCAICDHDYDPESDDEYGGPGADDWDAPEDGWD